MKSSILTALLTVLAIYTINAQPKQSVLRLNNSQLQTQANISRFLWEQFTKESKAFKGKYFAIVQFNKTPGATQRNQLKQAGIELGDYIPDNAFSITLSKPVSKDVLITAGIQSIVQVPLQAKLSVNLLERRFPAWSVKQSGTVDVLVNISRLTSISDANSELEKEQYKIVDNKLSAYHILTIRLAQNKVSDLASLPFVDYVQSLPAADKKLNDEVRASHKASVLNAPITAGGENLKGRNVVIGIGDDADLTTHIDIVDRIINRAPFLPNNHGVHVAGTAAGGGIKEALYQGVAPLATMISQVFSGIIYNAAKYVADHGMVVTNHSYGSITGECEYAGTYDLYSKVLDDQAFQLPELLHVFAAGNDGPYNLNCGLTGYHSTVGGYQASKNILAVAQGHKEGFIDIAGSRGPVRDGRIKPELVATGSDVRSTGANNIYFNDYGSSMAAPVVTGGAALLIEKYKQMNGGANPKSGLVKAWLMNGATDIEEPGPDFKSGYGWLNLLRSVDMVKNQHHFTGTVAQGGTNLHPINIPAGVSKLKVMLYWHDPAAAVFTSHALVNDVDLELASPSNTTTLPWILDTSATGLSTPATRGIDHINNAEQITLDNPVAGTYTLRVKGSAINVNSSQEYFIVYDYMLPVIDLTFPSTGEPLVPGEQVLINWNAYDLSTNTFTLEYSTDNGANWNVINANIAANKFSYEWLVPSVITSQAKVRIKRNGTALIDESLPFAIITTPTVTASSIQCEGYFSFEWTPVNGATDYEVMLKQGPEMLPVATTTSTTYTLSSLSRDSVYWVTVRPRINGIAGRRATAIERQPNNGSCSGSISNNDLRVDTILLPNTGRKFTSSEITTDKIEVRIKNIDDAPVANFTISYSINGGAYTSQNVSTPIPALGTYTHTFSGLNFSPVGTYNITAVVKNVASDPIAINDTMRKVVQQLPNDPITVPYVENFDAAPAFEAIQADTGLTSLPIWDLYSTTPFGRVRSFVNSGIARSGSRALTLDVAKFVQAANTNYLIGTFNLANYAGIFPDELGLRFDFSYKLHGKPEGENKVWIRASDTLPWIEVFDFNQHDIEAGIWKKTPPFHLHNIGASAVTSSVQVKISQTGVVGVSDNENFQGITIDDLRWYSARYDYYMIAVDTPVVKSCGLNNTVPLSIKFGSFRFAPTVTPFAYQLNNGPIIRENAPVSATSNYTFNTKLNLSAPGDHTIKVWVEHPSDDYHENDTLIHVLKNQPIIASFPYLQNFDTTSGSWYGEGRNVTWQYGTPASIKINKAASGSKAWKTSLVGSYNDNELSYLYSPCFNISSLATPYLSFSMAMDLEQCNQEVCDRAWVEYSNNGVNWSKLGAYAQGTSWYNRPGDNVWDSAGFRRWHTASIPLPTGSTQLQLRFVMQSDGSLIKEGVAIDDIHIYDRTFEIYTTAPSSNPVIQNVSGNTFTHFVQDGKLIASVNPNGNNLGSTAVQAYLNGGGFSSVRASGEQYYHDRNITIKPANTNPTDSTTIRFYFTDAETETLTRATSCATCIKPIDAYTLGFTKYDDNDDTKENGTLNDNVSGRYSFINQSKVLKVPYDKGYYAEFKVKDFSEFWLNNGGANANTPL
ncbi:MAG: family serine peptidase, partial [Segetibacter sp.]|nr:family serine peptidase [Segetibacter sp.]